MAAFEAVEGPFYVVVKRGHVFRAMGGPYLGLELAARAGEAMAMEGLKVVREVGRFK